MDVDLCRASRLQDALGLDHLVRCTVSDNEELGGFERRLVLHDTVLGNANAVKRGGQRTQPADHHGTFQCSYNPTYEWAEHDERTDARDNEKSRPEQQTPKAAPKGTQFAPDLHAVTGVVVTDDMLFGVIVLPNDGQ